MIQFRQLRFAAVAVSLFLSLSVSLSRGVDAVFNARDGIAAPSKKSAVDAAALLDSMTIEEKVGQMVMVGIPDTSPGDEAAMLIERCHVGGVILFGQNVAHPAQVAALTDRLQGMAMRSGAGVPLLVAIDQEGGPVARIQHGVTPLPSPMAIGAVGSRDDAYSIGRIIGEELRAMGVNMNMAPVLDVNNNPDNPVIGLRSFGEDPSAVATLGTALAQGLQAGGVLATAKHFPGHGDTDTDSHVALPTISHDRARLDKVELVPFRAAIAAGVDAIMSAHITFPAIDPTPGLPATLSRRVLTGLLREEFGFDGLIVTDALEMQGVADQFTLEEAAVMAVEAGADMVLVAWPDYWPDAIRVVQALAEAVQDGRIAETRIDASVGRILQAKGRLGLFDSEKGDSAPRGFSRVQGEHEKVANDAAADDAVAHDVLRVLANEESVAIVRQLARDAVTVVRNDAGHGGVPLLPINPAKVGRVLVVSPAIDDFPLLTAVAARLPDGPDGSRSVMERVVPLQPTAADIAAVVDAARQADTVIIATAAAAVRPTQAALVRALQELPVELMVVAVREPYDLSRFPDVSTYVVSYGFQPLHIEALVEVLFGEHVPRGRLPVAIPGLYPVGHGLGY